MTEHAPNHATRLKVFHRRVRIRILVKLDFDLELNLRGYKRIDLALMSCRKICVCWRVRKAYAYFLLLMFFNWLS